MNEKIAFAAWGFISLHCKHHAEEMQLKDVGGRPFYVCTDAMCTLKVPALVYEKISDDIIKTLNKGKLTVGAKWYKRYCGKNYQCEVIAVPTGKQPVIAVTRA